MNKIPAECRICREPVSRTTMEGYLDRCAQIGADPIARALALDPPGILCGPCLQRTFIEALLPDENETPTENADRVGRVLRGEP